MSTRKTSNVVANNPGCAPLKAMYQAAVAMKPKTWTQIAPDFLEAMQAFDANVADGSATMGDLQNGKGDFFNDLLALILENYAGVDLFSRGAVPGLIIPKHNLDVTYPNTGLVEFMVEAKMVGTPKHPGSPKQKALGRDGAADLDKRVKEIGFKTIDLKAEYARRMASAGVLPAVPAGDLTTWLRSMKPRSHLFISARVTSKADLDRVEQFARSAGQVVDSVGLYCYMPDGPTSPTTYREAKVGPDIAIERVLYRTAQDLAGLAKAAASSSPQSRTPNRR